MLVKEVLRAASNNSSLSSLQSQASSDYQMKQPTRMTTIWSSSKLSTVRLKCGLVESVGQGRAAEGAGGAPALEPIDALDPFTLSLGAICTDKAGWGLISACELSLLQSRGSR